MMNRHTLQISTSQREQLQQQDIFYCDDLPTNFSTSVPRTLTAVDLWELEQTQGVPVFHAGLDKLLGGGLPARRVCLVSGSPGVGKTALCLQLCCDVQVPLELGGAGGQALFISTDAGFCVERLSQIAAGCPLVDPQVLLSGVHVVTLVGITSLTNALRGIPQFLKDNPRVRLIVVDSFSLPFLCEEQDTLERTKQVHLALNLLENLVSSFDVTVVLTVQLTTLLGRGGLEVSKVIPCLGEGVRHRTSLHIMLEGGTMFLLQSSNLPRLSINFSISAEGLR